MPTLAKRLAHSLGCEWYRDVTASNRKVSGESNRERGFLGSCKAANPTGKPQISSDLGH
jgi:hypothetical protein